MSSSASFLFQGRSVSDPFPAVSKRGVGSTVKGELKAGKRNSGPEKGSDNELSVTRIIQALDRDMTGIFQPKPRPDSLTRGSWFPPLLFHLPGPYKEDSKR